MNQNRLFKRLRQACRLLFPALFLVLFRLTNYSGADTISYAVNIFFRWDPLVGDEPLRGSLESTRALTTPGCCISSRYRRRHGGSEPSHHRA